MSANSVLKLDFDEIESDDLPLKLSALTHAVRVSNVNVKCCLGPAGDSKNNNSTDNLPKDMQNSSVSNMKAVKISRKSEMCMLSSTRKAIDYELYDKYALLKFAEKQRRSDVRKELEEKRKHFLAKQSKSAEDLSQRKESANDIKYKAEQRIIEEAENLGRRLAAENEQRLREQHEENQKLIEHIKMQHALRKHYALRKAIVDCQLKFGEKYEEFSKKIRSSKSSDRIEKLKQGMIPLLMKYNSVNEKLKKSVNEIELGDLKQVEQLLVELDARQRQFDSDLIADAAETVVDSPAVTILPESSAPLGAETQTPEFVQQQPVQQQPVQQQPVQQQQVQQQVQHQQAQLQQAQQQQTQQQILQTQSSLPATNENTGLNSFVSPNNFAIYVNVMAFYTNKVDSVKPLQAMEATKKYRSNCQKAINIPVNAISAVSAAHLQDKYDKLYGLISGAKVNSTDGPISVMDHPLGRDFCLLLLAKKFVSQGDSTVSSNPQAAFPIAAVIVAIWQKVPEFGQLFLAYAFKESPYLVPYFIPQIEGQSTEDYYKSLGYRFTNGVLEKQDMYLKRQSGLVKLYAAVMVTKPRAVDGSHHPHGIDNGWRWLNSILNLEPLPDICATLILGFLQTAGFEMLQIYRNQFMKLLKIIQYQYLPRLSKVDEGGPKARLEVFLAKVIQENTIEKPPGLLAPKFW